MFKSTPWVIKLGRHVAGGAELPYDGDGRRLAGVDRADARRDGVARRVGRLCRHKRAISQRYHLGIRAKVEGGGMRVDTWIL